MPRLATSKLSHPPISAAFSAAVIDMQGTIHSFSMASGTRIPVLRFVQQVLLLAESPLQAADVYLHTLLLVSHFTDSFMLLLDSACSPRICFFLIYLITIQPDSSPPSSPPSPNLILLPPYLLSFFSSCNRAKRILYH